MSYADKVFVDMCKDILTNGTSTEGGKVRPVWPDTEEPAYTIKQFGVVHQYDLQKEFPIITLRKTPIKSAINETRWIYQKKSNNIHDLKPHVWDSWADENGSIGNAYGYQVGIRTMYNNKYPMLDQMDHVLHGLKDEPFGRRHIISLWGVTDLNYMKLQPCCWSVNFNVTNSKEGLVLNMVLNQRSNDILAANAWNVCQYAALLMMVARHVDMIPGKMLHVITDAHIYDRHIPIIKELISREQYPAPTVYIRPEVKNFYDITEDDFVIENYQYGAQITGIDVAV